MVTNPFGFRVACMEFSQIFQTQAAADPNRFQPTLQTHSGGENRGGSGGGSGSGSRNGSGSGGSGGSSDGAVAAAAETAYTAPV